MPEDFYELLGVDPDASPADLKRAYRRRAREYHPDVNDDDRAGDQFKTVRRVYDVLSDPNERAAYDRLGHRTYVAERMDGFSPLAADRERRRRSGTAESGSETGASGAESSRSSSADSVSGSGSASARSTGARSRAAQSTRTRSSASNASSSSTASSASTARSRNATTGERGTDTATGSTRATASGAAGATDANAATRTDHRRTVSRSRSEGRGRAPSSTGEAVGSRTHPDRRLVLRRGWVAVAASFLVYLAGLSQYALAERAVLLALTTDLWTAPVATLAADGGPSGVVPFVADAVGSVASSAASPIALALPLGAVALPLALGATVARAGRGTAWLYPLGALTPVALIAVGAVAPAALPGAVAVDLLALAVLPVAASVTFLGDVGRYLLATR